MPKVANAVQIQSLCRSAQPAHPCAHPPRGLLRDGRRRLRPRPEGRCCAARGIIGSCEATEHVQRLAGGIDRLASACGLTAPQPGYRSAAREAPHCTRVGPAAKGERGTGFPRAAAGPPLHRQRSQIRLCRSAPLPRDFGPGRSAAASTLGRRCAARWASPSAPAGRWPRADCGYDPHPRGLMASVGTTGAARGKDRSRPHLPTGRCWVSGRALNLRPTPGRLVRPPLL